jgi:hypothetical protein
MNTELVKETATTDHHGALLFQNACLNRDTAFTPVERKRFHLEGLLPAVEETLDDQVKRVYMQLILKPNDLLSDTSILLRCMTAMKPCFSKCLCPTRLGSCLSCTIQR